MIYFLFFISFYNVRQAVHLVKCWFWTQKKTMCSLSCDHSRLAMILGVLNPQFPRTQVVPSETAPADPSSPLTFSYRLLFLLCISLAPSSFPTLGTFLFFLCSLH